MQYHESVEKKRLILFRSVIDSLLGLEEYLTCRDGEMTKALADRIRQLYNRTDSMIRQSFCEQECIETLEEVLALLKEERQPKQEIAPVISHAQEDALGETELFEGREVLQDVYLETTLLHAPMRLPFLVRKSTKEKILINRDVFKIGKERSYVDYYVDNDAVSRSHADIVRQKDAFFVIDHNSLNHTFLEGKQIPAKQYVRLESGQSFVLADETFTFYYEAIGDTL